MHCGAVHSLALTNFVAHVHAEVSKELTQTHKQSNLVNVDKA
jgi:hypothetical protein